MPPNGKSVTAPAALAPALAAYKSVTADRLTKPDDGDWLMFRRTYNGWGYSPLDQITTANASHLHPVWSMATGQIEGHQAPPIVNNGVMFVATPGNQVLAINAKTGDLLWRFKRPIPEDQFLLHSNKSWRRSVGGQGVLRGIRRHARRAGRKNRQGDLERQGRGLCQGLLHVTGAAGDQRQGATRHFRRRAWRARLRRRIRCRERQGTVADLTIPAPGEAGSETWAKGDQWKTGGGSISVTGVV